jgi:S1-C subfamily serine protease
MVVGAPYGLSYTMTSGYISGRHSPNAVSDDLTRAELFQTDAAINPGNSGGPMFNMNGEVVGVVSHILSKSGGFEGLGFAVTSNLAQKIMVAGPRFWSGVDFYYAGPEVCQLLNLPQPKVLIVQKVAAGSPSDRLGLRAGTAESKIGDEKILLGGDILLGVQGVSLAEENAETRIREAIAGLKRDGTLTVSVWRRGQRHELSVALHDAMK